MKTLIEALSGANNADEFIKLLGDPGKEGSIEVEISWGGRRFKKSGYKDDVSLSDIIRCAEKILKEGRPSRVQKLDVVSRIRKLENAGNDALKEAGTASELLHSVFKHGNAEQRFNKLMDMSDFEGFVLENYRGNKIGKLRTAIYIAKRDRSDDSIENKILNHFKARLKPGETSEIEHLKNAFTAVNRFIFETEANLKRAQLEKPAKHKKAPSQGPQNLGLPSEGAVQEFVKRKSLKQLPPGYKEPVGEKMRAQIDPHSLGKALSEEFVKVLDKKFGKNSPVGAEIKKLFSEMLKDSPVVIKRNIESLRDKFSQKLEKQFPKLSSEDKTQVMNCLAKAVSLIESELNKLAKAH